MPLIDNLISFITVFSQNYQIVMIVALGLIGVAIYKKPKESFKFFLVLLALFCIYYVFAMIMSSMSSGSVNRNQDFNKSLDILK